MGKEETKRDGRTPTPRASLIWSLSKSPRPFRCRFIMRRSIAQILLGNTANKWIICTTIPFTVSEIWTHGPTTTLNCSPTMFDLKWSKNMSDLAI